jgi:LacI family transcriptional regulator
VTIEQRYAGYERAIREAGLPLDPALVVEVPSLSSAQAAEYTQRLLQTDQPPTALFALNNQIGLGALGAIQRLKWRIPADVALIVFDDVDYFAVTMPSITAISQPAFQMGQQAMRLLAQQIEHAPNFEPEQIVLKTELITRESI